LPADAQGNRSVAVVGKDKIAGTRQAAERGGGDAAECE